MLLSGSEDCKWIVTLEKLLIYRSAEGARKRNIPKLSGKRTEIPSKDENVIGKDQSDDSGPFSACDRYGNEFQEGSL